MTKRFVALDSWRGIAACLIVFFHFRNFTYSHLASVDIINHAWLFVDFFFVLSGFVITASYQNRLEQGYSLRRFIFLRLGRIYPLHIFMLMAFLAFEFLRSAIEG